VVTFTRPHIDVEIEHLPQPDNGRKVNQAFVLQFRRQFFLRFTLRLARDRAEESAGCFLKRLNRTIGSALPSLHQNSQPMSQGTYSASSFIRPERGAPPPLRRVRRRHPASMQFDI